MSGPTVLDALRPFVWQRAQFRCEYCLVREDDSLVPHEPDHIIARQHRGPTTADNLAVACVACNRRKGPNLSSVDPDTGQVVPLFHPRRDQWAEHFRLESARIIALTPAGRATSALLELNAADRLAFRRSLRSAGSFPD